MEISAKKVARARLFKRIGLIGAIVSSVLIIVVLVIAFLPKGSGAFTIRIDDLDTTSHYRMSPSRDGNSTSTFLRAQGVKNAKTTSAWLVEQELVNNKFEGQDNINDGNYTLALVYTVWLNNQSTGEDQLVKYNLDLDGYGLPSNSNSSFPLDYFRVLIQTEVDGVVSNTYYGNRISDTLRYRNHIISDDPNEYLREPIWLDYSSPKAKQDGADLDELGNPEITVLNSAYGDDPTDPNAYCVSFGDYTLSKHLVNAAETTIPAGKQMRFTYVAYFEGGDLDCKGEPPVDSYLLLSLHFGY